ncbi:ABC transporter substrate-binding protein [Traorella massiliensis]|uniref:ABC transporter substrate-binding protein n=1 Tax=Traorella massiliensis TaxID=1903263 RepID=UPI0008F93EB6|nr:extracellular solute-binding protein [Traorella massiliensis]
MKKFLTMFCSLCLCLGMATGCSSTTDDTPTDDTNETGEIDQTTFEELLEAGKENGKKVTVYSTHSVVVSACEAFKNKFDLDVEFECTQIGDTDQITQVATEVSTGAAGADIIFIQDGARVLTDLVDEGYVVNWYNQEIYDAVGEEQAEPLLVWDYCNKVFIYNTDNVAEDEINNIWYVTDEKYAGTVMMKDPFTEGVNMDFLTVVTSDENAALLEEAYKEYYGEDLVLDDDCPNAGYQWIKMLYNNGLVVGTSDGDMAQSIGAEGQTKPWSGLITLNKYVKNLEIGYKLGYTSDVTPFAGFIYPIYGLLTSNADNPEMAKAFLCWLYTEDGWFGDGETTLNDGSVYVGMTGRQGDYSANTSLGVADGDQELSVWKDILIVEDPEYAAEHRADVEDFINLIK